VVTIIALGERWAKRGTMTKANAASTATDNMVDTARPKKIEEAKVKISAL
jgi:hypothetical protein